MTLSFSPTESINLYDYQADAVEALRQGIRSGLKRIILCAGTGAGKTVVASHLLNEADRKGSYALFLVDRVTLVTQTSRTLDKYGIRHGVVQGINDRWSPRENVQVCSVQTLAKRTLPRSPNLFIYDECHCQYADTLAFMDRHPEAIAIGLTATPFTSGMGNTWQGMVNVISTNRLIESGYLIRPTIYVAKSPDDADLSISMGEFSGASAGEAGIRIIGNVVEEWIKKTREHFGGPVKTIVFSPTVDHGQVLCRAFADAGFNFQQVSYKDGSDDDRAAKIAEFKRPDSIIHGLVSCAALTKGFDVPDILCGISCRPYRKSLSSHMQEIGRIMRSHEGKDKALWLDHSGNIERFAVDMFDVWENGPGELSKAEKRDSTPRKRDETTREKAVCPQCSGVLRSGSCLACGYERPARSEIVAVEGSMREFDPQALGLTARKGLRADCLKDPKAVWLAALAYTHGHSTRGADHALKWAKGIFHGVYPNDWPARTWGTEPPPIADQAAYALIEREQKRFRKTSKRRAA